jgi:DNA-binding LytR/AlgR family response regulator
MSDDHAARIRFTCGPRTFFARVAEILWIEAEGNYSRVHTTRATFLARESIGMVTARLEPHGFTRIQKSYATNIDAVQEMRRVGRRAHVVVLTNGAELPISPDHRAALEAALLS